MVLNWTASTEDIDGYQLNIRETEGGAWTHVATIPAGTTTYSHAATFAGEYGIIAYTSTDSSANYATDNDLPNLISSSYTIWNNHAPATAHSGFIFGLTSGTTCLASSGDHDMYCYDGGQGNLTWLYSGDYGTFGGGNDTNFYGTPATSRPPAAVPGILPPARWSSATSSLPSCSTVTG